MNEALRERQATPDFAEQRVIWHKHVRKADARMVGRHIEGPEIFLDLHACRIRRNEKACDAPCIAVVARGARKRRAVGGDMHTRGPHLFAIDHPAADAVACGAYGLRFHMGRIRSVIGFGQTERNAILASQRAFDHRLLVIAAVAIEHGHQRKVSDNGVFVLQIVMQAEALGREMLADHRHPEIGAVLAAVMLGDRKTQMSGLVGESLRLTKQVFPFMARQTALVEIGARPFAAMIEETDVVVALLERLDGLIDETIKLGQVRSQIIRQREIQRATPGRPSACFRCVARFGSPRRMAN